MCGCVCQFIQVLWQEGDLKSYAADLISGQSHELLRFKSSSSLAWWLYTAWTKHELPNRATLMPFQVGVLLVGFSASKGDWKLGLAWLLSWQCLLRIGLTRQPQGRRHHLGLTKGGRRRSHVESLSTS